MELKVSAKEPKSQRAKELVRGFTLVELLIAIGLFSITVSIAMGGLASALRSQRQVAGLISADNNVSLVLEQMAREIRTGYDICRPGSNCYTPSSATCLVLAPVTVANEIDFLNANSDFVAYRLSGGVIQRAIRNSSGVYNFSPITGGNVVVQYMNFTLSGNIAGDCWPPRVTISVGIVAKGVGAPNDVTNLQTTVSARELDS